MATDGIVHLEAWGGEGGNPWSHKVIGALTNIIITYDTDGVNSIRFKSKDENGKPYESGVIGVENGMIKTITIDSAVEKLISIEGSVGTKNSVERVTSLGFTTTKTKHGPVGTVTTDNEFSCLVSENPIIGFHGHSSTVLNSIGISIAVVTSMEAVGPWPAPSGGGPWKYISEGPICLISVTYEKNIICSLQFATQDANYVLHRSPIFGRAEGRRNMQEILIDTNSGERIIGIDGAYGPHAGATLVKSLTFITNRRRSIGPFGVKEPGDTPFTFSVEGGDRFAGFHGRCGELIDSIGTYKQIVGSAKVGPYKASNEGTDWSYEPQGLISRIFGYHQGGFDRVQFESIDANGNKDNSRYFGDHAYNKYSVDIDKDDRITGISGTFTKFGNWVIICGFYIYTKKKTHGPLGTEKKGTKFSFKVKNGYVSGFHGRSSVGCHAIGFYVKPS